MPPIILTVLQGLFLLLLYVFVARAVRAVLRDVSPAAARPGRSKPAPRQRSKPSKADKEQVQPARVAPRQLVVHGPSGAPRVMRLDGEEITFGRGDHVTVPLSDPYTSDRHARIYHDGKRWLVTDLGSTNGTFLNQVKVTEPTPIAAGDQLGIGRTVVEVRK